MNASFENIKALDLARTTLKKAIAKS